MRTAVLLAAILVALALPAHAQDPKRLPLVVFDVRGFTVGLGRDATTAFSLGVRPEELPGRSFGGVAGVHLYPLRGRNISLGIGGEAVIARARAEILDGAGVPSGIAAVQRLRGISGVLSLNFGHRDGWSYLSAGMGPLSLSTHLQEGTAPAEPPPQQMTINMGGGARWFASRHIAFAFDVRFYQTEPEVEAPPYGPRERSRLTVLSGGISIR